MENENPIDKKANEIKTKVDSVLKVIKTSKSVKKFIFGFGIVLLCLGAVLTIGGLAGDNKYRSVRTNTTVGINLIFAGLVIIYFRRND